MGEALVKPMPISPARGDLLGEEAQRRAGMGMTHRQRGHPVGPRRVNRIWQAARKGRLGKAEPGIDMHRARA